MSDAHEITDNTLSTDAMKASIYHAESFSQDMHYDIMDFDVFVS